MYSVKDDNLENQGNHKFKSHVLFPKIFLEKFSKFVWSKHYSKTAHIYKFHTLTLFLINIFDKYPGVLNHPGKTQLR